MDIRNAVEMEANLFGVVNDTHDKKEGMGAFLEKRAANLTDFSFAQVRILPGGLKAPCYASSCTVIFRTQIYFL